ncbi:MAG: hypothetical protein NC305_14700 [Lachnospiraceae bacterium]|nr:hypothetical protein [Butyrivibrio sp.]MCM1411777.1 hypothetical protein [Lachnospiraceae bacterium]
MAALAAERTRHGRGDYLRAGGETDLRSVTPPWPVNKMASKVRAGTRRVCNRHGAKAGNAMKQWWGKPYVPVPQGKRGMLWARSGQLSHLPPPAVGVTASVSRRRIWIFPAQRSWALCRG